MNTRRMLFRKAALSVTSRLLKPVEHIISSAPIKELYEVAIEPIINNNYNGFLALGFRHLSRAKVTHNEIGLIIETKREFDDTIHLDPDFLMKYFSDDQLIDMGYNFDCVVKYRTARKEYLSKNKNDNLSKVWPYSVNSTDEAVDRAKIIQHFNDVGLSITDIINRIADSPTDSGLVVWPPIRNHCYFSAFVKFTRVLEATGYKTPKDMIDIFIERRGVEQVHRDIITVLNIMRRKSKNTIEDFACMSYIDAGIDESALLKLRYPDFDYGFDELRDKIVKCIIGTETKVPESDNEPDWHFESDDVFMKTKELFHEGL